MMKFEANSRNIQRHLKLIGDVVPAKSSLAIITCIEIRVTDSGVYFHATDLERSISVEVEAEPISPGVVCVPGKEFISLIDSFDAKLTIYTEEETTLVVSSSTSEFRLPAHSESLPIVDTEVYNTLIKLQPSVLQRAIDAVSFAVSNLDSDIALRGVHISCAEPDKVILTATNRYKIARSVISADSISDGTGSVSAVSAILPPGVLKSINLITDASSMCALFIAGNYVKLQTDGVRLVGRILVESFPNCTPIIAIKRDILFKVRTRDVLVSAKRILLMLKEKIPSISFDVSMGELVLSAHEANVRAREVIPVTYDGEPIRFSINGDFLIEACSSLAHEYAQFACDNRLLSVLLLPGEQEHNITQEIVIGTIRK